MKPGKTGFARIFAASINSLNGLKDCWQYETAFRQNVMLCTVLLVASFFVANSAVQWLHLMTPCFVLIISETLNSAIEAVVDRVGSEIHELSRRAKDAASAAVFICLCWILVAWSAIVWENFFKTVPAG